MDNVQDCAANIHENVDWSSYKTVAEVAIYLALVCFFIPCQDIIARCCASEEIEGDVDHFETYSRFQDSFPTDYDKENPLTS